MERSVAHQLITEAVLGDVWPMFTSCVMSCEHFFDPDARLQFTNKMTSYDDGKHQFGCASSPQYRLPHREVNRIIGFSFLSETPISTYTFAKIASGVMKSS